MDCNYQEVDDKRVVNNDRQGWKTFLRQIHISSGVWTMFFMAGLYSGAPTVFIPQLQAETDFVIDDEMSSWLYSISNFTSMPWVLILPLVTRWFGRKPGYISTCLAASTVFIILYFSRTPYDILTAGVIHGFVTASNLTIMTLIQNEYTSPKYRGVFINITSASFFWGIWTSNAIGTYFYWKYVAVLGMVCSAYTMTVILAPESPVWLASKGKFDKTEDAYRWIYGVNEESDKELHELIRFRKDIKKNESLKMIVRRRDFYRPLFLCVLIGAQYSFSGKIVCSAYAIEVLSKITDGRKAAQSGMLILDGVTILGMYFGSFLSKMLNRRTLYFSSGFIGVFFMFIISMHIYLVKLSVLAENNYVTILLLVAYSISISCGSVVMCISLYSEIVPLRYETISYMVISSCFLGTNFVLLKLAPMAFNFFGIHGTFLFCGVTCGVITVYLFLNLPETKGKTLLEIAEYFKDVKKDTVNIEQDKQLINIS